MPTRRAVLATLGLSVAGLGAARAEGADWARRSAAVPSLHGRPDWSQELDRARGRSEVDNLRWLESGVVPGRGGRYGEMVEAALLDLRRLTEDSGAVAAGTATPWRYAWPRDGSFVAAAFARAGHRADGERVLRFFARRQGADGSLEARYLLERPGVPDARPRQEDGPGWVLWSLGRVVAPPPGAPLALDVELRALLDRSTDRILRLTRRGRVLPPASPDYWEVAVSSPPLGQVAPMAAGLRAAGRLYARLGETERASAVGAAAATFRGVIREEFGPSWQRFGDSGGRDAAAAMAMPPFLPESRGVAAAWWHYQEGARRPAGGLAPGTDWWRFGESWTPEVALVAYTAAASGRADVARSWLDWLDAHRLPWGSLPEKVLADGRPAGPAPLAWTAALVVLTVAELEWGRLE